ncbi:MAG: hypothetical protein JNL02_20225 [Saprospiraceae bacterium]|nr:hypothetical protein [Saprospiraceae bacterium]
MTSALTFSTLPLLLLLNCNQPTVAPAAAVLPPGRMSEKVCGLTFVAPPEPFPQDPMPAVKAVGANWIAVVPYAFTRKGTPSVRFAENNEWQWWGEGPEGVRTTIRLAHAAGLKVMLKPQVYIPGGWTGALDFSSPEDWAAWEAGYERYILYFARLAAEEQPDMLCLGTEFNNAIQKRPAFWTGLIQKIRAEYKGKLTYSANWDDWSRVPFWSELDYIGLGGYFPLVQQKTPSVDELKTAWQPIAARLRDFSKSLNKPVLFTEFGYLSVDSCGWRNWELERGIEQRNINEQAQANCYEALFSTYCREDWWGGGFLWKWFPNMRGHEGYPERDYTPQGKAAEAVLRKWYGAQ